MFLWIGVVVLTLLIVAVISFVAFSVAEDKRVEEEKRRQERQREKEQQKLQEQQRMAAYVKKYENSEIVEIIFDRVIDRLNPEGGKSWKWLWGCQKFDDYTLVDETIGIVEKGIWFKSAGKFTSKYYLGNNFFHTEGYKDITSEEKRIAISNIIMKKVKGFLNEVCAPYKFVSVSVTQKDEWIEIGQSWEKVSVPASIHVVIKVKGKGYKEI